MLEKTEEAITINNLYTLATMSTQEKNKQKKCCFFFKSNISPKNHKIFIVEKNQLSTQSNNHYLQHKLCLKYTYKINHDEL